MAFRAGLGILERREISCQYPEVSPARPPVTTLPKLYQLPRIRCRLLKIKESLVEGSPDWSDDIGHMNNQTDGGFESCISSYYTHGLNKVTHSLTHSLPGTTTHVGSWPTQEDASNHLCPWP